MAEENNERTIGTFEEELRKREELGFENILFLQIMKINNSETIEDYIENVSRLEDPLACFFDDEDKANAAKLLEDTQASIIDSKAKGLWSQNSEDSMWKAHAKLKFRTLLMPIMRREGWLGEPKRSLIT
jgi:hypothetical protein